MADFLKDSQLNSALEDIFEYAEEHLILISPYIKLHSRFKDILKAKSNIDRIEIIVVFGKNEKDPSKSFNEEDLKFLMDFPNIKIKYEPRLHAKYYANESFSLLSSMNLYDFSQNNNIEFGIITRASNIAEQIAGNLIGTESLDTQASAYFHKVIQNSQTIFEKKPVYQDKLFGLSKTFGHSEILIDEFPKNQDSNSVKKEVKFADSRFGYCIRTGEKIEFNPKKPFNDKAFKSWNRYKDEQYQEKFCHYSGEPSNGETSFAKPILKKNWSKIKKSIK